MASIKNIIKLLALIILVILALLVFIPRTYEVPSFKERPGTQYWQLETGSRIGYTFINGDTSEQTTPIIYLHGGPGGKVNNSQITFFRQLSALGYDIYLYDQIGSGHSDRLDDISEYSVRRHTEDLTKIVETINAQEVILFGHSWGAMLALEYFSEHQDKVSRLILSGPGPVLPINYSLAGQTAPDSLNLRSPKYSNKEGNQKANNLRTKAIDKWASLFKQKLASDKEADDFFTYLNQQLHKSTTCSGDHLPSYEGGSGYYAHIMTYKSFYEVHDKRKLIKGNPIPVLILKGQCDNQKWGFTHEYLSLFPNAELRIFEDAGHHIEQERFGEYINVIEAFLSTQ